MRLNLLWNCSLIRQFSILNTQTISLKLKSSVHFSLDNIHLWSLTSSFSSSSYSLMVRGWTLHSRDWEWLSIKEQETILIVFTWQRLSSSGGESLPPTILLVATSSSQTPVVSMSPDHELETQKETEWQETGLCIGWGKQKNTISDSQNAELSL